MDGNFEEGYYCWDINQLFYSPVDLPNRYLLCLSGAIVSKSVVQAKIDGL